MRERESVGITTIVSREEKSKKTEHELEDSNLFVKGVHLGWWG